MMLKHRLVRFSGVRISEVLLYFKNQRKTRVGTNRLNSTQYLCVPTQHTQILKQIYISLIISTKICFTPESLHMLYNNIEKYTFHIHNLLCCARLNSLIYKHTSPRQITTHEITWIISLLNCSENRRCLSALTSQSQFCFPAFLKKKKKNKCAQSLCAILASSGYPPLFFVVSISSHI